MIFYLVGAAILIAIITYSGGISNWWPLPTYWLEIILINLILTLVVFIYLEKIRKEQPQIFTQFYLLSIIVKMAGSLSLIAFIVWSEPNHAVGNVVVLIISYLSFTFLEVNNLLSRPDK